VKFSNVLMRVLAVLLVVFFVQLIAGMLANLLIPTKVVFAADFMRHILYWMFLTNAVTIATLSVVAVRTEWRGWKLGAIIAAIPATIGVLNGIEGVIFLKNSHIEWPRIFLATLMGAAFSVPVWMLFFGKRADRPAEHFHPIASKSRGERAWKFVVCDVSYLALYLIAGTIIYPYIKGFYATQTLPSMPTLFSLQLLVRGPAFVALCLLLVRMLGMPRISGALAVGALFALLSGVAPLLMPNPYFPDSVRWMHFFEVTGSNFVFGAIVGWLWGQPEIAPTGISPQAA